MKKTNALRVLSLVLAVVLCLSATACNARKSKYGDAFRFPLCAEPRQLDPQVADDAASVEVLQSLMEGLTRLDETGEAQPAVAKDWETNGATVVFHLRESTWSDGTPLTAADFAFAWKRATDAATRSPLKSAFDDVLSVTATDDKTLTVTLKAADAAFPKRVAQSVFFPCNEAFFEKSAGHYGMEKEYILGNGPFTISSWSHGEYLILRKNAQYYAQEEILPDAVRYVMDADSSQTASLLKSGGLDAGEVSDAELAAARRQGFSTQTVYDGLYALWFNTRLDELNPVAVRAALCGVLDREKLCAVWGENQRTAAGFVPPDVMWDGKPYVREADSFGTVTSKRVKSLSSLSQMTLLCGEDDLSVAIAKEILQAWQKHFSLYIKMEKLSQKELADRVETGDFELALYGSTVAGGTVTASLSTFLTGAAGNLAGLSDGTFDKLLAKAEGQNTRDAYALAEQQLYKVLPCYPLYYPARTFAFGEGVEGVLARPFGGGVYGAVYDFRRATK